MQEKEYLKTPKEIMQHLLEGGKVGCDYWENIEWMGLNFSGDFIDSTGLSRSCWNINAHYAYFKYIKHPKLIDFSEVPDYLERGAWLQPASFGVDDGLLKLDTSSTWVMAYKCGSVENFVPYHPWTKGKWIVVKEPTK